MPLELLTMVLNNLPRWHLMNAAVVSRSWRAAAQTCDDYYFNLSMFQEFDYRIDQKIHVRMIKRWCTRVERSAPNFVGLDVGIICNATVASAPELLPLWTRVGQVLGSAVSRLKRLTLMIETPFMFKAALDSLCTSPAPVLRNVLLALSCKDDARVALPVNLFAGVAPKMRHLSLHGVIVPEASVPGISAARFVHLRKCDVDVTAILCGLLSAPHRIELDEIERLGTYGDMGATLHSRDASTGSLLCKATSSLRELNVRKADIDVINDGLKFVCFEDVPTLAIAGPLDVASFARGTSEVKIFSRYDLRRRSRVRDGELDEINDLGHCSRVSTVLSVLTSTSNTPSKFSFYHDRRDWEQNPDTMDMFTPVLAQVTHLDVAHNVLQELLAIADELPALSTLRSNVFLPEWCDDFWPPSRRPPLSCMALRNVELYRNQTLSLFANRFQDGVFLDEEDVESEGDEWDIPTTDLWHFATVLGLIGAGSIRRRNAKPKLKVTGLFLNDTQPDEAEDGGDYRLGFSQVIVT